MTSHHPLAELIGAYLDGLPGAADVLNDALEESGRDRLAINGAPSERLACVLEHLLSPPLQRQVALDFAKHVLGYCESPYAEAVFGIKRVQNDPSATPAERLEAEEAINALPVDNFTQRYSQLSQLGWTEHNTPQSSAAWSLWGALQIPLRYVAQAAQRVTSTECAWQIEHLKQLLKQAPTAPH